MNIELESVSEAVTVVDALVAAKKKAQGKLKTIEGKNDAWRNRHPQYMDKVVEAEQTIANCDRILKSNTDSRGLLDLVFGPKES